MLSTNERLEQDVQEFKERILNDPVGVLDPEGVVHHEFVKGEHGRKLDFDKIETDSDFYIDWVSVFARTIRARYEDRLPDAVVGIANGANRLSRSVGHLLGKSVLTLTTVKLEDETVRLDQEALEAIASGNIKFALEVEDVGTTGSTMATVADHLREVGVNRVEAITTWQRSLWLPKLDVRSVLYGSMIVEPLPNFSPEACRTSPDGFCAQGVRLIEYSGQ